jgi:hypothetical protein
MPGGDQTLLLAAIAHYDKTMTRSSVIRSTVSFAALGAILALSGCASSSSSSSGTSGGDPYCSAVTLALPPSALPDYHTALQDINALKTVVPQGKDPALETRILAVERSLEAIKKAGLRQPTASQLAAYKASALQLVNHCLAAYKGRGYKGRGTNL